jgi:hypothetical protein
VSRTSWVGSCCRSDWARAVLALGLLLTAATPAWAEVADKVPSLGHVFRWAIIGTAVGYAVCRFRPSLGLLTFPVAAYFHFALLSEIHRSGVGQAILRELGIPYLQAVYASLACIVVGHVTGALAHFLAWRRSILAAKRKAASAPPGASR